ncbi:MAG TPA: SAM-dependent methyltransferase [Candidatus Eremiobacteraceae bacterium]|nr:SAM-dependent methyltransferase [Candidatus Eremiobacteraceae bacterium]
MSDRPVTLPETANWVAFYRALESERPDAIFKDPYARSLAGSRGEEIVREMPRGKSFGWPMVVRTAVMDDVILRLAPELDGVLNLAAGLDARPYRLPLPAGLRWYEVDYPEQLEYKTRVLGDAKAVCVLERIPLDLSDAAARKNLFARVGAQCKSVLVISEGLLVYLKAEEVGALADDLSGQPSFHWWLTDLASPWVLKMIKRAWGKSLGSTAEFQFAPEDASAFFSPHGWRIVEYRSNIVEAQRLKREFRGAWFFRMIMPGWWRQESRRSDGPMAGVILLENAKRTA